MPNIDVSRLLTAAALAARNSYSPYSKFPVGAALQTPQGDIFTGCNVENASFGLTNCAERTALFTAVARGYKDFVAIGVVSSGSQVPYPCGACRQVLAEFCKPGTPVFVALADNLSNYEQLSLGDLLPKTFKF